jgi:hypothetical protein
MKMAPEKKNTEQQTSPSEHTKNTSYFHEFVRLPNPLPKKKTKQERPQGLALMLQTG